MDDAKEDEVAVTIPDTIRSANLAAVEFPLAVKPTQAGKEAALATVGGVEQLSKVTADEERALKLNLRPTDHLSRPMVAQRNASDSSTFVFKVKRRRLRPRGLEDGGVVAGGEGNVNGGEDTRWSIASVEAVGTVHTMFTFNGLADAQFLSCRPIEEAPEKDIDDHIAAALGRKEPMEVVPASFLPPFPRLSQESREEKMLRREKKQDVVRLERDELLVYHRFGEDAKHRSKKGLSLVKEARAIEHMREQLDRKWGIGKRKNPKKPNRPSRLRKGVSGHNEVKEQQLIVVLKILEVFEKRPMYFMWELEEHFQNEATYSLRDLVPVAAYYFCNGPWRSRWVRFGYRPEDHPSSRFEQLLEFRLSAGQLRAWADALKLTEVGKTNATTETIGSASVVDGGTKNAPESKTMGGDEPALRRNNNSSKEKASDVDDIAGNSTEQAVEIRRAADWTGAEDSGDGVAQGKTTASHDEDKVDKGVEALSKAGDRVPNIPVSSTSEGVSNKRKTSATNAEEGIDGAKDKRVDHETEELGKEEEGGGFDDTTPKSARFGVPTEVSLTSKTKGRFASQVVLNGVMLTARNRQVIGESPIRAVQELSLSSARLEYPNMSTGWWPQRTIRKMRAMSLEGIHECVKLKKQNFLASKAAAAAAAAASAPSASAAGKVVKPPAEVNESLNISGNPLAVGEGEVAGSPSANPAIHAEINAESLKSSETISKQPQQPQQHQEQTKGVYEANSTAPRRPAEQKMPANLSRRDFLKMASRMEDAVEVVPSLPPEPTQGRSQGLAGHGSRRVVGKPGSGGRSGTGRIVTGGVLAAKGGGRVGGIQRRKKEGSTMTHNGDDELELVMKEADAEMVGTSNDEDEKDHDSESDDWNSSDLVDDSADDAYSEEASDGMDEFAETDDNRNDDAGGLQKGKEIAETKQS